eukprot:8394392-Pyramimonas_sp.AAC.1
MRLQQTVHPLGAEPTPSDHRYTPSAIDPTPSALNPPPPALSPPPPAIDPPNPAKYMRAQTSKKLVTNVGNSQERAPCATYWFLGV